MIKHIVFWKFADQAEGADKATNLERAREELAGLTGLVPGMRSLEVAVGADATSGWISVRDHGPGIPPAEQARIFREFYRAPEAYRSGVEGTGLGLALVKRHIEALGGTVDVSSTVGEGARFTIRVPRVLEVTA